MATSVENVRINSSMRSLPNGNAHKHVQENFECLPYAEKTFNVFTDMLELSLLKDPVFLLFTLSNFCTSIGFNIPYVYIVVSKTLVSSPSSNYDKNLSEFITTHLQLQGILYLIK